MEDLTFKYIVSLDTSVQELKGSTLPDKLLRYVRGVHPVIVGIVSAHALDCCNVQEQRHE